MRTSQPPCVLRLVTALLGLMAVGFALSLGAQLQGEAFALSRWDVTTQAVFSCADLKVAGNAAVTSDEKLAYEE